MTAEKKEDINGRRRAEDRSQRNKLTAEQNEETNARRRATRQPTSTQRKTEEERVAMLAHRKAKAAAKRNTPCKESIAIPCPCATTLPTINRASTTHKQPTKEGTASPTPSPSSMSMPEYSINTEGNKIIFTSFT
jgi:hypothetical protein